MGFPHIYPNCNIWNVIVTSNKKGSIPLGLSLSSLLWSAVLCNLAVKEGFEPSIRYKRIHTFQACSLSHSDTSPFGRDNNQKNEICQVETIDLEQKKILGDIIRQNYVYIRRRIYAKYRKKSGIACNYLSCIRCCIWRHWNQSTVCPAAMLPHRTSRYYWSDSSWDSVADFLVHDADHQF